MRLSDKAIITLVVVAVGALGVFFVYRHDPRAATAHAKSILHHYVGVSEAGEIASYQPVEQFAKAIGRQPNIVLYYARWKDPFETGLATEAYEHGALIFVQIDPEQASMRSIAAGQYDGYLRSYADEVRSFGHPVVIGFAAEMNGDWDSWGWHHTSPATWIAAWRHVVTLFRGQGARNVTWIWTVSQDSKGTGPLQEWWPGANYVTWVGIDGYYYRPPDTFDSVFGQTIIRIRGFTGKPLLLSETAIGPLAGQAAKIPDLFAGVRDNGLLGFVWFDQAQHDGVYHQDWRLDTPAALKVFRRELKSY